MKLNLKIMLAEVRRCRGRLALALLAVFLLAGSGMACRPDAAQAIIRHAGYLLAFAGSLLCLVYLIPIIREGVSRRVVRQEWLFATLCIAGGGWLVFAHADFAYKIAMDEYILASTARNMHESREVIATSRVEGFGGGSRAADVFVDKRPWFYPFVVSVLHDVAGYRPYNPFVVNALVGLGILALTYCVGYAFAGRKAGALAVLLWASLPLLAQNATGAGMELLNLFMVIAVLLLAIQYLRDPTSRREGALSLTAVLLTYTRYESALFLLPVLLIILLGWWRARRILLSWGSLCGIVLLLGVVLQVRAYAADEAAWELTHGATSAFSLEHLIVNLPHTLNFFYNLDATLANSLLLSSFGVIALIAFPFLLRTEWRRYWTHLPVGAVSAVFLPFFLIQLSVVISFHAGRLDSPFVSRYALLTHVAAILAILALAEYVGARWKSCWSASLITAGLFVLAFTLPINAKEIFSRRNFAVREQQWFESLGEDALRHSALVLDRFTLPWALRDVEARHPAWAVANAPRMVKEVRVGKYPAIYFVERLHYTGEGFSPSQPHSEQMHEIFEMELLAERSFRPFSLTRIYQLNRQLPN